MPRKSATTAAELEHQAATDSALGDLDDLDDQGLERLPEFDHEQQLADLDARADRLNGRSEAEAKSEDEFDPDHVYHDAGQTELPGTPDADTSEDFLIPTESSFGGKDFVSAPGLKAIGERLISVHVEKLSLLEGVEVRYLWKRRGGTSGGNPKLGALQRPGGLLRYFTGGVTFIAYLSADHCRDMQLSQQQIEANLFHQLLHADTNPDDDDAYRIRGHSFEGFVEELDVYGTWSADLREMTAHAHQLPLDQAIADAGDDADEGEESE